LLFFLVNNVAASESFKHSDIVWAILIIVYLYANSADRERVELRTTVKAASYGQSIGTQNFSHASSTSSEI
jgi:hypothetical protein